MKSRLIKLFKKNETIDLKNLHCISFWTTGLNNEAQKDDILKLRMHDKVYLIREPKDTSDPNTIAVKTKNGASLGFVGKYRATKLAPLLDKNKVMPLAYIIDLKSDLKEDVFGVKIAIPMENAIFKRFTRKGIDLSFNIETSDNGNPYLLLNCEQHRLDSIVELFEKNNITVIRKGNRFRPGNDGKNYFWYMLLDKEVSEADIKTLLVKKFPRLSESLDREIKEEYINIRDNEISSLQEQNAILAFENNKLYKKVQRYKQSQKELNMEFQKIVQLTFDNVDFYRDSIDIIKNEIKDYTVPLGLIRAIQSNPTFKGKAIPNLDNWLKSNFETGQYDAGCIYFKKGADKIQLLVSFENQESENLKFLENH